MRVKKVLGVTIGMCDIWWYCGVTARLLWIDFFLPSIIWASIKFIPVCFVQVVYCRFFPVSLCLQLLCVGNILFHASPLPPRLSHSLASVCFFLEELPVWVRLLLIHCAVLGGVSPVKSTCAAHWPLASSRVLSAREPASQGWMLSASWWWLRGAAGLLCGPEL